MALETHDVLLRVTVDASVLPYSDLEDWDWKGLLALRPNESVAVLYVDSPDPEIQV